MVRGYWVSGVLAFLEGRSGRDARERAWRSLPREMQAPGGLEPGTWCPRESLSYLLGTVAALSVDRSQELLSACGESIAGTACDTFLRMAMRVMTPELFAKKLPRLWELDHDGGGPLQVDLSGLAQRRARATATGLAGFEGMGPAFAGWMTYALRRLGTAGPVVQVRGAHPDSTDAISWELGW